MKKQLFVGALIAGSLLVPTSVLAHTAVAESNPADRSTIDEAPEEVMVRFGNESLPAQPGAISEGRLEVIDACGKQVSTGETEFDAAMSSLTVASGGEMAGRYEIHWFASAADGDEQQGFLDFVSKKGATCSSVSRSDAGKDTDLGPDVRSIRLKGSVVTIKSESAFACKNFGKKADDNLDVHFDTNHDRAAESIGSLICSAGKLKLKIAEPEDEDGNAGKLIATAKVKKLSPRSIAFTVPSQISSKAKSLDLHAQTSSESDDCSDNVDDPVLCFDRAPDLGWLHVQDR